MTYDEKLAFLRRYRDAQRTMRRLQKAGALLGGVTYNADTCCL